MVTKKPVLKEGIGYYILKSALINFLNFFAVYSSFFVLTDICIKSEESAKFWGEHQKKKSL